jgi:hypothetical protein
LLHDHADSQIARIEHVVELVGKSIVELHSLAGGTQGSGIYCEGDAVSRKLVNAICRKFPGTEVSDPWGGGHDAWNVGGKIFACIGAVMPGVSIKTDSVETGAIAESW